MIMSLEHTTHNIYFYKNKSAGVHIFYLNTPRKSISISTFTKEIAILDFRFEWNQIVNNGELYNDF